MFELPSAELLNRIHCGDSRAEGEVLNRYVERLIELVRRELAGSMMRRRLDSEAIVNSACRTFIIRARKGKFVVEKQGDLLHLLAEITRRKLSAGMDRHKAMKRDIGKEREVKNESEEVTPAQIESCPEPTPLEVAALEETIKRVRSQLVAKDQETTKKHQTIFDLLVLGTPDAEIATQAGCSLATVRRVKKRIERLFEKEMGLLPRSNGGDDP